MNTSKAILISVIVSVLVFSLGVGLQASFNRTTFGTQVQNDLFYFTGGIKVGGQGQFSVDSNGNLTTTGSSSVLSFTVNGGSAETGNAKASAWYPQTALTLGAYQNTTSTTSTIVSVPFGSANGLAVGDGCIVGFNNAPSSTSFGEDAVLWAVGTKTSTGTLTLWNGSASAATLNTTSSYTGASSTVSLRCVH